MEITDGKDARIEELDLTDVRMKVGFRLSKSDLTGAGVKWPATEFVPFWVTNGKAQLTNVRVESPNGTLDAAFEKVVFQGEHGKVVSFRQRFYAPGGHPQVWRLRSYLTPRLPFEWRMEREGPHMPTRRLALKLDNSLAPVPASAEDRIQPYASVSLYPSRILETKTTLPFAAPGGKANGVEGVSYFVMLARPDTPEIVPETSEVDAREEYEFWAGFAKAVKWVWLQKAGDQEFREREDLNLVDPAGVSPDITDLYVGLSSVGGFTVDQRVAIAQWCDCLSYREMGSCRVSSLAHLDRFFTRWDTMARTNEELAKHSSRSVKWVPPYERNQCPSSTAPFESVPVNPGAQMLSPAQ